MNAKKGDGNMAYTRAEFIAKIGPMAQKDAQTTQILASLTIAQAILESGDGNSQLTVQGNALFGIKATSSWRGKVWTGSTIEYYGGNRTNIIAGFRAYNSWEESIKDHSALLTEARRYRGVVGEKDYKKACQALQAAGYATDPLYAAKLISLIEAYQLTKYDNTLVNTVDELLYHAVSKIIKSGIVIDFNSWKRMDLMKLTNVPALLSKLGGLEKLIDDKVIGQQEIWGSNKYNEAHVRALLIKYAATLN